MDLSEFQGEYTLDAVDYNHTFTQYGLEYANCISFRLNGHTYTVVENPDDGYRSCMGEIFVDDTIIKNAFSPVTVRAEYEYSDETDIMRFVDVETHEVVIEVGTDEYRDHYPCFVSNFNPEAMIVNKPVGWTHGCVGNYSYDALMELMNNFYLCGALSHRWPTEYNIYKAIAAFTNTPYGTLTIGNGVVSLPVEIHEYMPPVHNASTQCNLSVSGMGNGQLQAVYYQLAMYEMNLLELNWYLKAHSEHTCTGLKALLAAMMSMVPHERITFKRIKTKHSLDWLKKLVGMPYVYNTVPFIRFVSGDGLLLDYAADLIKDDSHQLSRDDLAHAFLENDPDTLMEIEQALVARLTPIIQAAKAFFSGETAPEKDFADWQRLVQLALLHDRTALLKGLTT